MFRHSLSKNFISFIAGVSVQRIMKSIITTINSDSSASSMYWSIWWLVEICLAAMHTCGSRLSEIVRAGNYSCVVVACNWIVSMSILKHAKAFDLIVLSTESIWPDIERLIINCLPGAYSPFSLMTVGTKLSPVKPINFNNICARSMERIMKSNSISLPEFPSLETESTIVKTWSIVFAMVLRISSYSMMD